MAIERSALPAQASAVVTRARVAVAGAQPAPAAATVTNWLALGHGIFFIATGVWPIISMRAFERVTGPKTDDWVVKTFGAGSSATLPGADLIYVSRKRIPPVYLLDAAAEIALIAAWAAAWLAGGGHQAP